MERRDEKETNVKMFRLRNLARCRKAYQNTTEDEDETLLENVMVEIQDLLFASGIKWNEFDANEDLEA